MKSGDHELVDQAIFNWFLNMRSQHVPLSASMTQEKAVIFAKELNIENFQASDGWLRRWKGRNNISFKTVFGESKSVTPEMVNAWSETSLPSLLSNYDLKDICNADEFGLFYPCLPNKTYQLKSEKCYGKKLSKIRIAGMEAANAMGDKLPMLVIVNAKNPRCFKNVKFLPCRYRNQGKSWIDVKSFEEWLRELERKLAFAGRNVDFVIDNSPARPPIDNLKAIKLFFLPPNTTFKTQPMDKGVICSLKAKHRKNVVRKIIQSEEKKKTLPKISLLQVMQMLVSAWDALSTQTIENCFRKSGIFTESQETAIAEDDDPFQELQDGIGNLRSVQPDLIEEDFDGTTFADVDAEIIAVQPPPPDAEIVAGLLGKISILPQFQLIRIFVNSNKNICPLPVRISGCVL